MNEKNLTDNTYETGGTYQITTPEYPSDWGKNDEWTGVVKIVSNHDVASDDFVLAEREDTDEKRMFCKKLIKHSICLKSPKNKSSKIRRMVSKA